MKFSTKEDIEAPIDAVFDMLCEFDTFERAAMRRGAEVQRVDTLVTPGAGMQWEAAFNMRGKRREVKVEMMSLEKPSEMRLETVSPGLVGDMSFELMSLSRGRTRVLAVLEIKPKSLSARLLVQSLKLAKTSLTKKYKTRIADYARNMEDRYQLSK